MEHSADKIKYSVIIPVYNAEATVSRCLDSLLCQSRDDTELIVINDGSADLSGQMCRGYADRYPQIKYIDKANGGVSSARNAGLDAATGEYVLFVDSDDYVREDYFQSIDGLLSSGSVDLGVFACAERSVLHVPRITNTDDAFSSVATMLRRNFLYALWTKVFRRDIIEKNALRFDLSLDIGEDFQFIFRYCLHINTLCGIDAPLYLLDTGNTDSLSRKRRDYLTDQLLALDNSLFTSLSQAELPQSSKKTLHDALVWLHYRSVYSCSKELLKYDLTAEERRRKIRVICRRFMALQLRPADSKCFVIALPVRLRMAFVIDFLVRKKK